MRQQALRFHTSAHTQPSQGASSSSVVGQGTPESIDSRRQTQARSVFFFEADREAKADHAAPKGDHDRSPCEPRIRYRSLLCF